MLSTSLVGYTTVLGGVAPMVQHGYGFFYRIRDDRFVHKIRTFKNITGQKRIFLFVLVVIRCVYTI